MRRHSHTSYPYPASVYDDDMCIKPPLLLWLALLYLCRGLLLPIIMGFGHFAGVNADAITLLRDYWSGLDLVAAIVAAPVLYAVCRRSASASRATLWIRGHGKAFLTLSACADVFLRVLAELKSRNSNDALVISMIASSVDVYFLFYVLFARRVRDFFLESPAPNAEQK